MLAGAAMLPAMTEKLSPAELAGQIAAARDRLAEFAVSCPDGDWRASVLESDGDPRPVGVIVDHVADAYEYLAGWIREVAAGADPPVDATLVDQLNASHAGRAGQVSQDDAARHLGSSGDAIIALVAGLGEPELDAGNGRARRLAEIAARHAETHRGEIERALAAARP